MISIILIWSLAQVIGLFKYKQVLIQQNRVLVICFNALQGVSGSSNHPHNNTQNAITLQHQWLPLQANCQQGYAINESSLDCLQVEAVLCCTYQSLCSRSRGYRAAAWAAGQATAYSAWASRAARAGHRRKACGGVVDAGPQDEALKAQHRGPAGLHASGSDLESQSHRRAVCLKWSHPYPGDKKTN